MITFVNVTKKYPDGTTAVDDLTMHVDEGSFTVFVGPSGCGKTTSMRMINRMTDPTSGVLTVDGADVRTVDPVKLRLGIGYVIQNAGLMPHQRVVDNVATVPVLRGESRRAARKAALDVLERVGLDPTLASRYPAQLSGGQQQRVGVARALAADPPILLMDEPFSAVDPNVRDDLQAEMQRLLTRKHTLELRRSQRSAGASTGDKATILSPPPQPQPPHPRGRQVSTASASSQVAPGRPRSHLPAPRRHRRLHWRRRWTRTDAFRSRGQTLP